MKFSLNPLKLERRLREKRKARSQKKQGKSRSKALYEKTCNLCHGLFKAISPLLRFCTHCKETNELFRFHDSLPARG